MAEAFERNASELLQTLKDDVERLLKDIEIKATKQISDDSAVFRRTVAIWYKQLLDTYDTTDEKIGSIIDVTEGFVAQIDEKAEAITDALYDKVQPKFGKMVDSLNNAVKLYTKKRKAHKAPCQTCRSQCSVFSACFGRSGLSDICCALTTPFSNNRQLWQRCHNCKCLVIVSPVTHVNKL